MTPHELTGLDIMREQYGLRGAGQTVVVIDSGIAYDHVALGGGIGPGFRVVGGWDFTSESDADPYDDAPRGGHGTHVAGIIGATGIGVAPAVDIVALRVFDDQGFSSFTMVENALRWVHEHRTDFANPITTVNLSIGAEGNSNVPPAWSTIEDELSQLEAEGIFITAAAGNEFTKYSSPGLEYPAASSHVVPAMSVDSEGQLSYFSQRHPRAIGAPGRMINSTIPDYAGNRDGVPNDFQLRSGTNMAAPYLAGASVLVREAMELVGDTNVQQSAIYETIYETADTIWDSATNQSYRRLNIRAAIDAVIPDDEYGSSAATAHDMGELETGMHFEGLIGAIDDVDCFVFRAIQNGTVTVQTSPTHNLTPHWSITDENNTPILETASELITLTVTAGSRYFLDLSSSSGIGRFAISITPSSGTMGDYNRDGIVSAADFTVWRDTLGSTADLRADGNLDGTIETGDFEVWKSAYQELVTSIALGDFDRDGRISAADYTVWRDSLGSTVDLRADADQNGVVEQGDYEIWKARFAASNMAGIQSVPEPTSLILAVGLFLTLLLPLRDRRF